MTQFDEYLTTKSQVFCSEIPHKVVSNRVSDCYIKTTTVLNWFKLSFKLTKEFPKTVTENSLTLAEIGKYRPSRVRVQLNRTGKLKFRIRLLGYIYRCTFT